MDRRRRLGDRRGPRLHPRLQSRHQRERDGQRRPLHGPPGHAAGDLHLGRLGQHGELRRRRPPGHRRQCRDGDELPLRRRAFDHAAEPETEHAICLHVLRRRLGLADRNHPAPRRHLQQQPRRRCLHGEPEPLRPRPGDEGELHLHDRRARLAGDDLLSGLVRRQLPHQRLQQPRGRGRHARHDLVAARMV